MRGDSTPTGQPPSPSRKYSDIQRRIEQLCAQLASLGEQLRATHASDPRRAALSRKVAETERQLIALHAQAERDRCSYLERATSPPSGSSPPSFPHIASSHPPSRLGASPPASPPRPVSPVSPPAYAEAPRGDGLLGRVQELSSLLVRAHEETRELKQAKVAAAQAASVAMALMEERVAAMRQEAEQAMAERDGAYRTLESREGEFNQMKAKWHGLHRRLDSHEAEVSSIKASRDEALRKLELTEHQLNDLQAKWDEVEAREQEIERKYEHQLASERNEHARAMQRVRQEMQSKLDAQVGEAQQRLLDQGRAADRKLERMRGELGAVQTARKQLEVESTKQEQHIQELKERLKIENEARMHAEEMERRQQAKVREYEEKLRKCEAELEKVSIEVDLSISRAIETSQQ
ncbi:hypothetical protein AB1Y20_018233 [Prymnesium parvum]|uniref:Centrosomal protein of 162 kDa n=1 Tax=Prymnesium parvum TaxID=97485 RepID=A0AB34JR83_PRYPA